MAHDRKKSIDTLCLKFKATNPDFRYNVRNHPKDIELFVKRHQEGVFTRYHRADITKLGDISPLKPRTNLPEEVTNEEDEDGFSEVPKTYQTLRRQKKLSEERALAHLKAEIDGFQYQDGRTNEGTRTNEMETQ